MWRNSSPVSPSSYSSIQSTRLTIGCDSSPGKVGRALPTGLAFQAFRIGNVAQPWTIQQERAHGKSSKLCFEYKWVLICLFLYFLSAYNPHGQRRFLYSLYVSRGLPKSPTGQPNQADKLYSDNIIWSQALPQYYNQSYAKQFSYQILVGLGTNFVGYGMAGLTRRFLVYPSYAVWPTSLVTIAREPIQDRVARFIC